MKNAKRKMQSEGWTCTMEMLAARKEDGNG